MGTPTGKLATLVLGCTALAVQLDGCAGTSRFGRLEDPDKHDVAAQQYFQIEQLLPGTHVTLVLRDGSVMVGRYSDLVPVAPAAYAERYERQRLVDGDRALPPLGSSVTLVTRSWKSWSGALEGFGFARVLVRPDRAKRAESRPFESFRTMVDSSGRQWSEDSLAGRLMAGGLPLVTAMRIQSGDTTQDVPLDRISTVTYRHSNGRLIAGVVIAVAFTAVIIVAIARRPKQQPRRVECDNPPTFYMRQAARLWEMRPRETAPPTLEPAFESASGAVASVPRASEPARRALTPDSLGVASPRGRSAEPPSARTALRW